MKLTVFCAVIVMGLVISCKEKVYNYNKQSFADVTSYTTTVKKLNDVVLGNNFPPMIASRNYVYANIAAYEVLCAFNNNYKSLAGQIKHLPVLQYADTANVDYHLAALLAFCKVGEAVTFPEGSMQDYVEALKHNADSFGIAPKMLKATVLFADSIGAQILRWSKKDNYLQLRPAPKFNVSEDPARWRPTAPMYASAVEPSWNKMRTLIMDSASQCMPARPPKYDVTNKNSIYYKGLLEVKTIQENLTEEQKTIAEFWDDNPFKMNVSGHVMFATKKFSPPGHWMNIVGEAAKAAKVDFDATVAAYAHCSIAIFDAFICCWDEKYRSNTVRPQTVIEKLFKPDFQPFIQTPPFPSYTSGHATISAAAAEIMTHHFGDSLSFMDHSLEEFGIAPRKIESFRKAALEAATSRLYGGIHFRFDNEAGTASGIKVGLLVLDKIKIK